MENSPLLRIESLVTEFPVKGKRAFGKTRRVMIAMPDSNAPDHGENSIE
jgi:hypothetical protein